MGRKGRPATVHGVAVVAGRVDKVSVPPDYEIPDSIADRIHYEMPKTVPVIDDVLVIGTGETATPEIAQEAHRFLRDLLTEMLGESAAEAKRILYGGSVNPQNANELISKPDLDGFLVGGSSLDPEKFLDSQFGGHFTGGIDVGHGFFRGSGRNTL